MRKSKVVLAVALAAGLLMLTGCGGYMEYMARSAKPNINACTETQYVSNNYQVLGTVRAVGEGRTVLGVYVAGKDGSGLLWDAAQLRYQGNFTGIKDVMAWSEYQGVLPPIFCQIKTTYVGTVVREKAAQ